MRPSAPRALFGTGSGDPRALGAQIYTGAAFDTCVAPSAATMRAWHGTSPFGAAGVYIGGWGRSCPQQPNLTNNWVHQVHNMGWQLMPLYVGSQAPCVSAPHKRKFAMSHSAPTARGTREGRDAVARARALGMEPRSGLYLDMEAYNPSDSRCAATTLAFVQGWDRAVRAAGYLPGFYSNANSGITHMERAREAGSHDLPEMVWYARWGVPPSVRNDPALASGAWQPHRRVHQYRGEERLSYGGHALTIDRNLVDAPVAVVR